MQLSRLIGILVAIIILNTGLASAQEVDLNQLVTLKCKDKPLGAVLESLEKDYKLDFAYSSELIPVDKSITLLHRKQPLRKILDELTLLADLKYQVIGTKIVLSPNQAQANGTKGSYTISGFVTDASSGEKLLGANIVNLGTYTGRTTNVYGFYSLTVKQSDVVIAWSYTGYTRKVEHLRLTSDTVINLSLEPSLSLPTVTIEGNSDDMRMESSQMSQAEVQVRDLDKLPALTGEVDVMRAMQQFPGVHFGDEGTVTLYVRGGGPDQNLILLDGVPLYNTYHLFGLVSIFNSSAINSIKLVKAGYPARYGGRLSSVLDVRMKEGNLKEFGGEASVGLLTSQVTLEGPIKKDTTSFLVSFRRTYADLIATPIIREVNKRNGVDGVWSFNFLDGNVKLNHKFSNKDRIYASAYSSSDNGIDTRIESSQDTVRGVRYATSDEYRIKWTNFTSALRWNHLFNNKLFSNTTILYSDYKFNIDEDVTSKEFFPDGSIDTLRSITTYNSDIRDLGFRFDFNYFPSPRHDIQFGGASTVHRFQPGVYALTSTEAQAPPLDSLRIEAIENNLFLEDDFTLGKRIKVNAGLRASMFTVEDTTYQSLEPRASMRYLIRSNLTWRGSYARMVQYLHLLNSAQIGFPVDLWVPPTSRISPQRAYQVATGLSFYPSKGSEISSEVYYRKMSNIIEYKNGASFVDPNENWEDKVEVGEGESYGWEIYARRSGEKFTGWVGYTWSRTVRQFDQINEGRPFPYKYDRTHDVNVTGMWKLSDRTTLSSTWVYGTGTAITLPEDQIPGAGSNPVLPVPPVVGFSDRNAYRLRDYHRLDLGLTIRNPKPWGARILNFSIYNVYNRRNPYFMYLGTNGQGRTVFKEVSYFPIIPSFRYAMQF